MSRERKSTIPPRCCSSQSSPLEAQLLHALCLKTPHCGVFLTSRAFSFTSLTKGCTVAIAPTRMRSFAATPHKNCNFAGNPNAAFLSISSARYSPTALRGPAVQDDEGELFRIPHSALNKVLSSRPKRRDPLRRSSKK